LTSRDRRVLSELFKECSKVIRVKAQHSAQGLSGSPKDQRAAVYGKRPKNLCNILKD
jgi:hypothetical protein